LHLGPAQRDDFGALTGNLLLDSLVVFDGGA
jgi:hypothetical protein